MYLPTPAVAVSPAVAPFPGRVRICQVRQPREARQVESLGVQFFGELGLIAPGMTSLEEEFNSCWMLLGWGPGGMIMEDYGGFLSHGGTPKSSICRIL